MNFVVEDTRDFTTAALMYATALSTATFLSDPLDEDVRTAVDRWSSGRFRKVVRRAKKSSFTKASATPGRTFTHAGVTLHLCVPTPVDAVLRDVSRAQVSGLQVLDGTTAYPEVEDMPEGSMVISSNGTLEMSPGKEAAAAAHVAQLLLSGMDQEQRAEWINAGRPLFVYRGFPQGLDPATEEVVIRDAGLTEVAPGSVTAVGRIAR